MTWHARLAFVIVLSALPSAFPPSAAIAADAVVDSIGPATEPRTAAPAPPTADVPLDATPNAVVPGAFTVDLSAHEHATTAEIGPDGKVRMRCQHAAEPDEKE